MIIPGIIFLAGAFAVYTVGYMNGYEGKERDIEESKEFIRKLEKLHD